MDKQEARCEYDIQKRARAGTSATLRACVSLYLIYLGCQIIRNALNGTTTMSLGLSWLFGGVLIAAALGFGWYILRRYRSDLEAARIARTPEEIAEEENP